MKKTGKIYKAWAIKNQSGGIETDSARMPIYWKRAPAKEQAKKYYSGAYGDGGQSLLRVEIKIL